MTRRTKLELEINKPTKVELLFDDPIIGESKFGPYAMFALSVNGLEYSFFAPSSDVQSELSKLGKGDKAIITKQAVQKENRVVTTYDIQIPRRVIDLTRPNPKVVSIGEAVEDVLPNIPQYKIHDKYYDIMRQSYADALEINTELKGITSDVARLCITLFIARSKTI